MGSGPYDFAHNRQSSTSRPDFSSLLTRFRDDKECRSFVVHNFEILKAIRGGLAMAQQNRISFNPRTEYWYRPERRFIIGYLADRWTDRFAPGGAIRALAQQLLEHLTRPA